MNDHLSLDLKYRPSRFEDVVGQKPVVTFLSRLITRGKIPRNILLHGSHGSGKTTLARLYMKALYCDAPTDTGSPCHTCPSCQEFPETAPFNWVELNAGLAGGVDSIRKHLNNLTSGLGIASANYKVMFIDEAHKVTPDGFEALKKTLEEPPPGFLAILATTELDAIPAPVQSRLTLHEVRPLVASTAIDLARRIATQEDICIEDDALQLLVGLKGRHARDLVKAIDQLRLSGSAITTTLLKEEFGGDYEGHLLQFFMALARRDLGEQVKFVDEWHESAATKVRLVQNFLLATYYNDICGVSAVIDPIIASIPTVTRQKILDGFRQRLHPYDADIGPFWRQMMDFWHRDESTQTEASLRTSLALFHETVNALDLRHGEQVQMPEAEAPKAAYSDKGKRDRRTNTRSQPKGRQHTETALAAAQDKAAFLNADQVRQLINAGSFLTQEYGLSLNFKITMWHRRHGVEEPKVAARQATNFAHALSERLRFKGHPLHRISVLENDEEKGLYSTVVAHIPPDLFDDTHLWIEGRIKRSGPDSYDSVEVLRKRATSPEKRHAAHWECLRFLCASVDPDLVTKLPNGQVRPLWELIGIPKGQLRRAGLIGDARRFNLSASLQPQAIANAISEGLPPLSAFDDSAWDWLDRGWEFAEYEHRKEMKKARIEAEARIASSHRYIDGRGPHEELLRAKLNELRASWPDDPYDRRRGWVGWWQSEE